MPKVLIGMSGGVDSSAAALVLQQQGFTCVGCTMRLYDKSADCGSAKDADDARAVCEKMQMEHHLLDFREGFAREVIGRFIAEYEAGRTPNPCLYCNRHLKFSRMLQAADALGCDYIATGHYARVAKGADGRFHLYKGADAAKDQSYVLYNLTQQQLSRVLFPLGGLSKPQCRALAAEAGFVNADKPDSQDICFVPDGDYVAFMEQFTGHTYPAGDFIDPEGRVLGRHRGAVRYTLGQRKGLGLALSAPGYVIAKDMAANTVTVGPESAVFKAELTAGEFNWIIAPPAVGEPLRCAAMPRYRKKEQPATVTRRPDGTVQVVFDQPQRAPTPGQAVVLYCGEEVLGGGIIC